MKNYLPIILCLFLLSLISHSQPVNPVQLPSLNWVNVLKADSNLNAKPGMPYGQMLSLSNDKNYIAVTGASNGNPLVAALSTGNGAVKFINSQSINGTGWAVAYDANNQLISLSAENNNNGVESNSFLRGFGSSGTLKYSKTINSSQVDLVNHLRINSLNYAVLHGINRPSTGLFISPAYAFDSTGIQVWSSTITDYDFYYGYEGDMTIDNAGNTIFTGKRQSSSGDPATYDIVIRKVNTAGVTQWQIYYDLKAQQDAIINITADAKGDIYFTGISGGVGVAVTPYVVKLSGANGSILWAKTLPAPSYGYGQVLINKNGNLIVSGYNNNEIRSLDTTSGNQKWINYGTNISYGQIALDDNGNVYHFPVFNPAFSTASSSDTVRVFNSAGTKLYDLKVIVPNSVVSITGVVPDLTTRRIYISGIGKSGGIDRLFVSQYSMGTDTLLLGIPDINPVCDSSFEVPVYAKGFANMLTMQGSINWNANSLHLDSVSNFGPSVLKLSNANFGFTQTSQGNLSFSWDDLSANGVSLADSTILFKLRFSLVNRTNGSYSVSISGTPTPLEFMNALLQLIPYNVRAGNVNINCYCNLTGRVSSPTNDPILDATVKVLGAGGIRTSNTNASGQYSIVSASGNYIMRAEKNNEKNKTNGVTTMDLAMIQSHILLRTLLNAPYKLIAADANNNGSITTADILFLRRMILGLDTSLPGNRTWAILDSSYIFNNPSNPFPFNDTIQLNNIINGNIAKNFKAIKIGDVNYDRNPLLNKANSMIIDAKGEVVSKQLILDTLRFYYDYTLLDNGDYSIQLRSKQIQQVMGFQFTIGWVNQGLEFQRIRNNPLDIQFGDRWKNDGFIGLSWNDLNDAGVTLKKDELILELIFKSKGIQSKPSITINSEKVIQEAFDSKFKNIMIKLESNAASVGIKENSLLVYPNPARDNAHLSITCKDNILANLYIYDYSGKIVYQSKVNLVTGLNRITLEQLPKRVSRGIYVVRIQGDNIDLKRQLVIIND